MPRVGITVLVLDPIPAPGERLFELACDRDLEGIDLALDVRAPEWLIRLTRAEWKGHRGEVA